MRTPQTQVYLKPARDDEEDDTGSVEKGDAEDGDLLKNICVVSLSTKCCVVLIELLPLSIIFGYLGMFALRSDQSYIFNVVCINNLPLF